MASFFRVCAALVAGCVLLVSAAAQETFPANGTVDKRSVRTALLHATVHVTATEVLRDATVLIEDGRIAAVGPHGTVALPEPVVRIDLKGYHLYPAFVDVQSSFGQPAVAPAESGRRGQQELSDKKGAYGWNEAIRPEIQAAAEFHPSTEDAAALRKAGIGAVLTTTKVGLRGEPRVHLFRIPSGLQVRDRPLRERLESCVVGIHVGLVYGLTDEGT